MTVTLNRIVILLILLISTACVSVSVPKAEQVKSKHIILTAPENDFITYTQAQVDKSWINPSTGNSISYFSNCNDPSDPGLKSIQNDVLSGLESPKIISSQYNDFNGRKALVTQVKSYVDGYPTKFEVIILKKNKCIYIINYVASVKSFKSDYAVFQKFLQGFKAL